MRNLLLTIRYLGTGYHGWQVQDNANTVQEVMGDAIEAILGKRENVTGCSRTDAGVHANMYCCTVRTENPITPFRLIAGLNAKLPEDISVYDCVEVDEDFHPRYSCVAKQYIYRVYNGNARNPFEEDRAYYFHPHLDEKLLDKEAKAFVGTHNFTAFTNSKEPVNENIRTVRRAEVKRDGDVVTFLFEADGFLYNMVRIMAGTLIAIGTGRIPEGSIGDIIAGEDRKAAGQTAPACGLYLNKVYYGDEKE